MNQIDLGGSHGRFPRILAWVSVAATVSSLLYYSIFLVDRVRGTSDHGSKPSIEDLFHPLEPSEIRREPWTSGHWEAESAGANVDLWVNPNGYVPVVSVAGLEFGEIFLVFDRISHDGNTYAGDVHCVEHGGIVSRAATLQRTADNRLRLHIDFASDVVLSVDLLFRRRSEPARVSG